MANVMTPHFKASYPNLLKPKRNDLNGKDEYSVTALFAKGTDLSALKKAAQDAIVAKWGADKTKWPQNLKSPFRDQAEKAKFVDGKRILPAGHEEGAIFLTLKSSNKPGVVDEKVQDIIDEHTLYAGCTCRATVRPYAYDNKGNRGVAFGLQNIQKVADGDPLSGRAVAAEEFAPVDMPVNATSTADANSLFG